MADSNKTSPFKDYVYACWTRDTLTGSDIVFKRLSPNPSEEKVLLSTLSTSIGCNMTVGTNSEVYVAWMSIRNSTHGTIEFRWNMLGGEDWGWSRNRTLSTLRRFNSGGCVCLVGTLGSLFKVSNDPSVAVDMLGGVHMAYAENLISTGGDIRYLNSDQCRKGSKVDRCSWSNIITVNLDSTSRDQFDPAIHVSNMTSALAPRGVIHVTALDRRADTNNIRWRIWHYYCSPGAILGCNNNYAWGDQVVSDVILDNADFNFVGEYHGITHTKTREVFTVWTDSRGWYPVTTTRWDIFGDWSRR